MLVTGWAPGFVLLRGRPHAVQALMNSRPTIIVLAAGPGRRFGARGHKLLQSLGPGTVLATTIRHAVETGWPVAVVTTAALAPTAAPWIATRDLVVLDEAAAAQGEGDSIAAGVVAHSRAAGWLVLPGDMPLVRPQTMLAVGQALAEHPVAYAQHQGRPGHPLAFGAELYSELARLTGDGGARRLVARYPSAPVEVDDPGVLIDVDTEADLAAARAAAGVA
jgi:molybdenum cofactor cytidylyltransferase